MDLDIIDGAITIPSRLTVGLEAIAQAARIRLSLIRTEYDLDTDLGLPWYPRDGEEPSPLGPGREGVPESEAILGERFNGPRLQEIATRALMSIPGVTRVEHRTAFDGNTRLVTMRPIIFVDGAVISGVEVTV
jgi:hypothetical protein